MPSIFRLFQTVRHLKYSQVIYQLRYRRTGKLLKRIQIDRPAPEGRLPPLKVKANLLTYQPGEEPLLTGAARFYFLNLPHDFGSVAAIDWELADYGKLWTYNLHYFEYLRQPKMTLATGQELIDAWIENEQDFTTGWEPYPLSLRLINWLQFYRTHGKLTLPAHVHESVHRQYENLQKKLEFHLGGNHLLENLTALRVTADYFADVNMARLLGELLQRQLYQQYITQGHHYEFSPLYHRLLLWRQLELTTFDPAYINFEPSFLELQLTHANRLSGSGDRPGPHFNDSTEGIAPPIKAIQNLAGALKIRPYAIKDVLPFLYREMGPLQCWMDLGSPGPAHQPGHSHADNLTFCLYLRGRPIIVDTGISTYEKNERRAYERSTAAHNTVTMGEQNSSDVWGGFRMGRRAKTELLVMADNQVAGYYKGPHKFSRSHIRSWEFYSSHLLITDNIVSLSPGTARLHFAAGLTPRMEGDTCRVDNLTITVEGSTSWQLVPYQQALGFNRLADAWCLETVFISELKTKISYS
ncbi:MAG: heparinase II/III family protein [Saprospiraceae bacterium]